jgi:hypothetical protein
METLPIGEVARRTGVRTSALRYYEEAGVLPVARAAQMRQAIHPGLACGCVRIEDCVLASGTGYGPAEPLDR